MVSYSGRTLDLAAGTLTCPAEIKDVIELEGNDVLVLLNTTGKYDEFDDETRCRNVWRVTPDGSVRWQIQQGEEITGDHPSFSSIWIDNQTVWAYSTNGLAYQVDVETGQLGETREMKQKIKNGFKNLTLSANERGSFCQFNFTQGDGVLWGIFPL